MKYLIKKVTRRFLKPIRHLKTRAYHLGVLGKDAPQKEEIIYIDPRKIKGHMRVLYKGWELLSEKTGLDGSAVIGGDWDLDFVEYLSFMDLEVFKSCYAHWMLGDAWEKTPFFNKYILQLQSGVPNRFSSVQELRERYNSLDQIFHTVRTTNTMSTRWEDLVKISIARDGRLIWGPDGKHRICIALCLGLTKMPVRVGFIHSEAVDYFLELRSNKNSDCTVEGQNETIVQA